MPCLDRQKRGAAPVEIGSGTRVLLLLSIAGGRGGHTVRRASSQRNGRGGTVDKDEEVGLFRADEPGRDGAVRGG